MACDKVLIDDPEEFLTANKTDLKLLKTLFLANTDVSALLDNPSKAWRFLEQISHCPRLESINLSGCNLKDADLNRNINTKTLTTILHAAPALHTVSLRNNQLSLQAISDFEQALNVGARKRKIIAPGATTCPPAFTEKQGNWSPAEPYTAHEYSEYIAVAEKHAKQQPALKKIHAYRAQGNRKKNLQIEIENSQSNLPISALLINGRAFLLPKYTSATPAVQFYNKVHSEALTYKKVTLLVHKPFTYCTNMDELCVCIVKIHGRSVGSNRTVNTTYDTMEGEIYALFRSGSYPLSLRRGYAENNCLVRKRYLISDYISGPDCFEHLEKIHRQINTAEHDYSKITFLDEKSKKRNLHILLGFALEIMTLHFSGIIHGDIKPEHCIMSDDNSFKIIDLGFSVTHDKLDFTEISNEYGTVGYMAPEALSIHPHKQTPCLDAFAFGITARQNLYPICYESPFKELLFLNEPQTQNKYFTPEQDALKIHFNAGIGANYGKNLAIVVDELTSEDPNARTSITSAFCKIANIYPYIAKKIILEKIKKLHDSIKNILDTFEQARILVNAKFADWQIIPVYSSLAKHTSRETILNYYCKLVTLNFFLKIFYYCNGQVPNCTYEVLEKSIQELKETHNGNCSALTSIYYTNPSIEDKMKYHFKIAEYILNGFAACAQDKMSKINQTAAHDLYMLQAQIREMWKEQKSIAEIACFAADEFNAITAMFSESTVAPMKEHLQGFIDYIQTNVIPARSPKLARLSM